MVSHKRSSLPGVQHPARAQSQGTRLYDAQEGLVWWAALTCLRESHRAQGVAVSWCGQEGPAGHPGGHTVAGSQLGGTLQGLEEEGVQGCGFYPHLEVPSPAGGG